MADQEITLGDASQGDGLDETVFEGLRANFLLRSRDDGYDVARRVQRHDRPSARLHSPVLERGRRDRRGELRPRERSL